MDLITQDVLKAKLARLNVELDITKPLKIVININDQWNQPVEYEFIGSICFLCGIGGHKQEQCSLQVRAPVNVVDHRDKHENCGPWVKVKSIRHLCSPCVAHVVVVNQA